MCQGDVNQGGLPDFHYNNFRNSDTRTSGDSIESNQLSFKNI